jgi:hypothetical protein
MLLIFRILKFRDLRSLDLSNAFILPLNLRSISLEGLKKEGD